MSSTIQKAPTVDPLIDSSRAWVSAAAVSLANGVGFGIAYTFGTFFDSMASEFEADKSATALIFGVTLLFFLASGSSPARCRIGLGRGRCWWRAAWSW